MLLQFVYFAFAIYGWWHWWRGVKEEGIVKVEGLSGRGLAAGVVVGAAGSFVLGFLMARYTDAALPHIDAALTSFSLVAQWWSTRKHIANWWLWIVVDAMEIGVFLYKRLYLTSVLFAFLIFWLCWGCAPGTKRSASKNPVGRTRLLLQIQIWPRRNPIPVEFIDPTCNPIAAGSDKQNPAPKFHRKCRAFREYCSRLIDVFREGDQLAKISQARLRGRGLAIPPVEDSRQCAHR